MSQSTGSRQIIALGGGGFGSEPGNPLLDHYILDQASADTPRVCFIPTASGDNDNYIRRFYDAFTQLPCEARHLSLFRPPTTDLTSYLLESDIIYVGGGNTHNMLLLWRSWNIDQILRNALESGIVLAGISAGSICWFEQGVTDSFTPANSTILEAMDCLSFLTGSNCPHYDGEKNRRPEYHRLMHEKKIKPGWAADDGVALHFSNGSLHRVVSSRRAARAYRVQPGDDAIEEREVAPEFLG